MLGEANHDKSVVNRKSTHLTNRSALKDCVTIAIPRLEDIYKWEQAAKDHSVNRSGTLERSAGAVVYIKDAVSNNLDTHGENTSKTIENNINGGAKDLHEECTTPALHVKGESVSYATGSAATTERTNDSKGKIDSRGTSCGEKVRCD